MKKKIVSKLEYFENNSNFQPFFLPSLILHNGTHTWKFLYNNVMHCAVLEYFKKKQDLIPKMSFKTKRELKKLIKNQSIYLNSFDLFSIPSFLNSIFCSFFKIDFVCFIKWNCELIDLCMENNCCHSCFFFKAISS